MAKIHKHACNTVFVSELMDRASSGPLMQAFILQALEFYSKACIAAGPAHFDSGLLSGEAWLECAKEVQDELTARVSS